MDKNQHIFFEQNVLEAKFFGHEQAYGTILDTMHDLHEQVVLGNLSNQLMLVEHAPVITITRSFMSKNVKTSEDHIRKCGIDFAIADRGGDVTFHGPGQLVGYPLLRLEKNQSGALDFFDIESFIRSLEQALLMAVQSMGINSAMTTKNFTGIWSKITEPNGRSTLRKLVAIGVGVKNGVSKHGFAINIDIDYQRYKDHIVPCGLKDRGIVTLKELFLKQSLPMPSYFDMVKTVSECLARTFSLTLKWRTCGDLIH